MNKILILGPPRQSLISFFNSRNFEVFCFQGKVSVELAKRFDCILSYGYRYILPDDVLNNINNKIINLHISFLPWNRGADPNLWSFLDDTPKGVSIHYIDNGIDTGDILIQKELFFDVENETLSSSYDTLCNEIEYLLFHSWHDIRNKNMPVMKQARESGSFHKLKDKERFMYLLTEGWNTPVSNLVGVTKKIPVE